MIDTWDRLLTDVADRLAPGERLPGFPIWYDEFRSLADAEDIIEAASLGGAPIPRWKQDFLRKNAIFWQRHREVIARYEHLLDAFPPSRRKFEWQAGEHRPLAETIMHFRPSGIRAKRPDYVPALVAITQTSILGNRRRLTPRETARLQGLPDTFEFRRSVPGSKDGEPQKDAASYKQMGNGVNVGAAYHVFQKYVREHAEEIAAVAPQVVRAVERSPDNPDDSFA
ncbi:hypothetical protein G5V59_12110 [Nocardioides sp. W3-2-3]|uniref:DNA cytosine methyltransferase n=1 Tax=Nocardioides convexus TaxID=2712224 RepID=UPI0024186F1A|nr:DNA cytosine methyltransferase [Nocardioides convexus]NHA00519.1 hypothetical protein [Nocardioides convexus]